MLLLQRIISAGNSLRTLDAEAERSGRNMAAMLHRRVTCFFPTL